MQQYNFATSYCKSNWSFNYLELSVNNVQSRADISGAFAEFFFCDSGVKIIYRTDAHTRTSNNPVRKTLRRNLVINFSSIFDNWFMSGSRDITDNPLQPVYEIFILDGQFFDG
jgi:hypothetical protein